MDRSYFTMIAATFFLLLLIMITFKIQIGFIQSSADLGTATVSRTQYYQAGMLHIMTSDMTVKENEEKQIGKLEYEQLRGNLTVNSGNCGFQNINGLGPKGTQIHLVNSDGDAPDEFDNCNPGPLAGINTLARVKKGGSIEPFTVATGVEQ
ncbi:MAG: hypothetical protein ABEJ83_05420 [Candidatus Nanohaloarchaea archaeon]